MNPPPEPVRGATAGAAVPPRIADYQLLRLIGQGSYGDVWLARGVTGVLRAIKVVWRARFTDATPFEREFKGLTEFAAISLDESVQMALLHVGRNDESGFFYYVMELADDVERGRDIDPASYVPYTLTELRARRGRLPAGEVLRYGVELARVLAGLHRRGLVHRDIKPSNVILVGGVPKLADIGLISPAGAALTYVGTEGFIPPEGPGAPAADVYALGKLFYELATGLDRQEFPQLPAELAAQPDRRLLLELNEIILRACDQIPGRRYGDGSALLADLERLQAGSSVRQRRVGRAALRWGLAVSAVAVVTALWQPWAKPDRIVTVPPPPVAVAPQSEAARLVAQARAIYEKGPVASEEELLHAEQLARKATELEPTNAEAMAARSLVACQMIHSRYDAYQPRLDEAINTAKRALVLDSQSEAAKLAMALTLQLNTETSQEGIRMLADLAARRAASGFVLLGQLRVMANTGETAGFAELRDRLLALPSFAASVHFFCARQLDTLGRFPEALEEIERAIALEPEFARAYNDKIWILTRLGDKAALRRALESIPARTRMHSGLAVGMFWAYMADLRDGDGAARVVENLSQEFLNTVNYTGPRDLLLGKAHRMAGRPEAAAAAWQNALRVMDRRLAENMEELDVYLRAQLLALLGREGAAREGLRLNEQMRRVEIGKADRRTIFTYAELGLEEEVAAYFDKIFSAKASRSQFARADEFLTIDSFDRVRDRPRLAEIKRRAEQIVAQGRVGAESVPATAPAKVDDKSVAVLAFANMSPDPDNAFFSDGVHEDVITQLAKIRDLRVISRTSVLAFRESKKPLKEIAGILGVAHILEGSVRRAGNRVRITAQLIDAATDEHLWAETYDRNLDDIFAIQGEIAEKIAAALKTTLSPEEKKVVSRKPTENSDAYDLFLRARGMGMTEQESGDEWERRVIMLEKAVALDPKFAQAWAQLAAANAFLSFAAKYRLGEKGDAALARAKEAMATALRLAPDDPEVIGSYGTYLFYGFGDYTGATAQYERQAELQPNYSTVFHSLAMLQRRQGHWAEALANARRACQLDPANIGFLRALRLILSFCGRFPEELEIQRRIATLLPDDLAEQYSLAAKHVNARGSFREGDEFFRSLPPTLFESPKVIEMRKDWARASHNLQEAIRLDQLQPYFDGDGAPRWVQALWAAHTYFLIGDKAGAAARLGEYQAEIRKFAEDQPDNVVAQMSLATMERILGHAEEARRVARRAAALDEKEGDDLSHGIWQARLATELDFTGDLDGALAIYKDLIGKPSMAGGAVSLRTERFFVSPALHNDPRFQALLDDPRNSAPHLEQAGQARRPPPKPEPRFVSPAAKADDKSVAVLAFANLSGDKGKDYLAEGFSEELLNTLAQVPALRVTARSSAFSLKGKGLAAPEMGAQLGVAYLVEGSVRQQGDKVRIAVQLIKAADGFQVWSRNFDRELTDIFALQDEVAAAVVTQLREALGGATSIALPVGAREVGGTNQASAYEQFLRGRFLLNQYGTGDENLPVDCFKQAVALDPDFALAWAWLGRALAVRGGYTESVEVRESSFTESRRAIQRALALEPRLAVAYRALIDLQWSVDRDWSGAAASLRRALMLAPDDPDVLAGAVWLASIFDQSEQGIAYCRKALERDPVNVEVLWQLGNFYGRLGRWAEAEATRKRRIEINPRGGYFHLAMTYNQQGRYDEALAVIQKEQLGFGRLWATAVARWGKGERAEADAMLAQMIKDYGEVSPFQIAQLHGRRQERDEAFAWLERAERSRDPGLSTIKGSNLSRLLSDDPRWQQWLRKLGLADEQLQGTVLPLPRLGSEDREDPAAKP